MRRARLLAVSLSVLLLAAPAMQDASARGAHGLSPRQVSVRHLYIVFLPGLCAWPGSDRYCRGRVPSADRSRATFNLLILALARAQVRYTPLYYSYSPDHLDYYTVGDSHSSVARSADALERLLRSALARDPQASFDLIGHSLGGVVAASWTVTLGRLKGRSPSFGLLRRIRSIVTFDSPLRGIHSGYTTNLVARIFGGAVWSSLRPGSQTITQILRFPDRWWRSAGHLHSIGNVYDKIIPSQESLLGDRRTVKDGNCHADFVLFRSCHGAVLADAALNQWVACHWVANPDQCRPQPTSTPTPTSTSTPSPTPTPLPRTPTPRPTPTATPSPRATQTVGRYRYRPSFFQLGGGPGGTTGLPISTVMRACCVSGTLR